MAAGPAQPLSRPRQRVHAPADPGSEGCRRFPLLRPAVSDGVEARRGLAARGPPSLVGAGLQPESHLAPRSFPQDHGRAWPGRPTRPCGPGHASGDRSLHCLSGRIDRVRCAGPGGRHERETSGGSILAWRRRRRCLARAGARRGGRVVEGRGPGPVEPSGHGPRTGGVPPSPTVLVLSAGSGLCLPPAWRPPHPPFGPPCSVRRFDSAASRSHRPNADRTALCLSRIVVPRHGATVAPCGPGGPGAGGGGTAACGTGRGGGKAEGRRSADLTVGAGAPRAAVTAIRLS